MVQGDLRPGTASTTTMVTADIGNEALKALRCSLDVEAGCAAEDAVCWSYRGVPQRAWAAPIAGAYRPTWRLHLETAALEKFSGSLAELQALSDEVTPPSLAAIVRSSDRPSGLDLVTTLDMHEGNFAWAIRVLAAAARVQAAEARRLASPSGWVVAAGLRPASELQLEWPDEFQPAVEASFRESPAPIGESPWTAQETSDGIEALKATTPALVVEIPTGISATFPGKTWSFLEVTCDADRPPLGKGLLVVLTTPGRGGPLNAMLLNELETGPHSRGRGPGGWWAPEGGFLVHRSFYPRALYRTGLLMDLLLDYARRVREANVLMAGSPWRMA